MVGPRTLLVLGRVSNLSTVWSNCLCAAILLGSFAWGDVALLSLGVSLLYVGGMYLNDACDVAFDRENRNERPIPQGAISRGSVFLLSGLFLFGGVAITATYGERATLMSGILVACIVIYNLIHKKTFLGVPVMAACRLMIYLVVAAALSAEISITLWKAALVMFAYIFVVTLLARSESGDRGEFILGMGTVLLALSSIVPLGTHLFSAAQICSVLLAVVWVVVAFQKARIGDRIIVGKTIGPLLAGICLVDLAIVASFGGFTWLYGLIFFSLFVVARIAQRFIPAS